MKYAIVTGASRGIGSGIAKAMLEAGWTVYGVSRSEPAAGTEPEGDSGGSYRHRAFDLGKTAEVAGFIEALVGEIDLSGAEGVYLINNAGVLEPVGPAESAEAAESERHLRINLLAPMQAAAGFLRALERFPGRRVIASISSGAAQRPYYGWSLYCSAKAGLEMWTRVLGVEQRERDNPVQVFSVAPGIVDTEMQASIRETDEERFRDKQKFVRYHRKGLLADPLETGRQLLRSLDDPQIENGANLDLRSLYGQ
jgi:benzil reductase ((S)-benzoin forming)